MDYTFNPTPGNNALNNSWQTWDNVLSFIKLNLGADVQKLEFSDERIIEILLEHTMMEFSAYEPYITYYNMTANHIISESPFLIYEFQNDFDYKILELKRRIDQVFNYGDMLTIPTSANLIDTLVRSNYLDMSAITRASNTMAFDPPNRIRVIEPSINTEYQREFCIELGVAHKSPLTISPGVYDLFRDLALGDIMIFLAKIRSKFSNFSTPFGQVTLDADQLLQDGRDLKTRVITQLHSCPPEQYIWNL
jgi:hypothetical protein